PTTPLAVSSFLCTTRPPPTSTLFPYTTLFRSAWKYNGTPLWSVLPTDWGGQTANLNGSPVIADYGLISAGAESTDPDGVPDVFRSEEHTSELQSRENLVCRLLLEKKKTNKLQY